MKKKTSGKIYSENGGLGAIISKGKCLLTKIMNNNHNKLKEPFLKVFFTMIKSSRR